MDCSHKTLFVFDFDDTLVEGWSDSWVLEVAPSLNLKAKIPELLEQHTSWCAMMDHVMYLIHESGCGRDDIITRMQKLKIKEGMARFLRKMNDCPDVDVIVMSDGNTQFISTVLESAGCKDAVVKVYANPATFDTNGRLRICKYHSHTCQRCQESYSTTCKANILLSSILPFKYSKLVYVGDGRNDVCPCLRLTGSDIVVARDGHPLAKELSLISDLKPQLYISDFDSPKIEFLLHSLISQPARTIL